jgi:PA14 domain
MNRTTPAAVALYRSLRWFLVALLAWATLEMVRPTIRAGDGLIAQYFTNAASAGRPAIDTIDTRPSTAGMRQRWNSRIPQQFSVRWIGYLAVPRSGVHTLSLTSDDGARLLVDGRLVVDNSGQHVALTASKALRLDRGAHAVVIEYVQYGGEYQLEWSWTLEGGSVTEVPAWALSQRRSRHSTVVAARAVDWGRTAAWWGLCAAGVWCLLTSWLVLRERATPQWPGHYRTRGCGAVVTIVILMVMLLPWPGGGLWRAVFLTLRDYQIPALRQILDWSQFQANIATPGAGGQVLPPEVRTMVRLLERDALTRYRLSPLLADSTFLAQQVVASAWPRRLEATADALFLLDAEPVPAGCKVTASLEGIVLARCP